MASPTCRGLESDGRDGSLRISAHDNGLDQPASAKSGDLVAATMIGNSMSSRSDINGLIIRTQESYPREWEEVLVVRVGKKLGLFNMQHEGRIVKILEDMQT